MGYGFLQAAGEIAGYTAAGAAGVWLAWKSAKAGWSALKAHVAHEQKLDEIMRKISTMRDISRRKSLEYFQKHPNP